MLEKRNTPTPRVGKLLLKINSSVTCKVIMFEYYLNDRKNMN